jgi:hypothetical protein
MNIMRVLIVGFAPGALGSVFRFFKFVPMLGGTRPFKLKLMKAFLTGKIPGDCKPLIPSTFIDT